MATRKKNARKNFVVLADRSLFEKKKLNLKIPKKKQFKSTQVSTSMHGQSNYLRMNGPYINKLYICEM